MQVWLNDDAINLETDLKQHVMDFKLRVIGLLILSIENNHCSTRLLTKPKNYNTEPSDETP